ncbi:ABA4-like family protein [Pelagerythrobacter rhizovicinus]|uniref:DUF4281 domain-containing protein n=1 Tax=Pelagerythrobacter rhizovicinus TaxID=2268576 RepID=A0A4Q2KM05_9SPHN|nr:ABA4-like family protein [Pelagerythrobacter rhizovicinus]RXZ66358.1 DUF4281 domain-containing protein [Pelagerythrobacter rhizovicinus]
MWPAIFGATNVVALAGWIILLALPRRPFALAGVLYLGIGLLSLIYAVLLVLLATGSVDGLHDAGAAPFDLANFSLSAIRSSFHSDGVVVLGWTHYLAFDLFVGLWIARDADAKGFPRLAQAPVLIATFLAGPFGLLVWLAVRERRARVSGRWR